MSDTTEAMRAALDALERCEAAGLAFDLRRDVQAAHVGLRSAMKQMAAAPTRTDSIHTGAVLEQRKAFVAYLQECDECEIVPDVAGAFHAAWLAAQPSPKRNDCEPVAHAYIAHGVERAHMIWINGNPLSYPDGSPVWVGQKPPPPAERHYCERCGLRLGSTLSVHICTPPGDASKLWAVNVQGPDDLIAQPSRLAALELAAAMNTTFGRVGHHEFDPIMRALVVEWPYTPDSHAAALAAATKEPQQ